MIFSTLSKASLALIATSILLILTQSVESHSYVDCVDWRFSDPKNKSWSDKHGKCMGYARRFPLKAKPFAKLDSDDPNRHYQQSHKDPDHALPCSDGKQGEEPGANEQRGKTFEAPYTGVDQHGRKVGQMTVVNAGNELCIRWPAKNHAVPDEKNEPVTIGLSGPNPAKDPTQQEFLKNIINKLNYKNCTDKGKDTDIWPCGGCFKVSEKLKPAIYTMQWRWMLNGDSGKEYYTSCADIKVLAKGAKN
ncbi:hypothetical protein BC939DRAFT_450391 [Gamsiella multidivaricata]|uniref:uncharacterized protein n=1 Tax=Gamsiella multidivaricata TaxID=101098 RepID=UPI00221ED925|nr:uncharacterized protein BC939DRAFT_450391 [Gamsiella multidivaricata]KAG0359921.1 hypothetical protein BGZ54_009768 [Gamsiella multidivaricata]KAI7824050.1 hypothetical protein BC939DRAFT_450391 [Gamsiella multidivaricata]